MTDPSHHTTPNQMARAAHRADSLEYGGFFLASQLSEVDALLLGCPPDQLGMLRLCRRPVPTDASFGRDCQIIAARFGLDPVALETACRG